jgi:hypothetical protein
MEKAVRRAVYAAHHNTEPTATLLVLPDWSQRSNTAYMRWLREQPQYCHTLALIKRQYFRFSRPDAWQGGEELTNQPAWNVRVLLVANKAALLQLSAMHVGEEFETDLARAVRIMGSIPEGETPNIGEYKSIQVCLEDCEDPSPAVDLNIPRRYQRLPAEPDAGTTPVHANEASTVAAMWRMFPTVSPLYIDWRQLIYTDGSATTKSATKEQDTPDNGGGPNGQQQLGSGIFRHSDYREASREPAAYDMSIQLDPAGSGITNTDNQPS